MGRLRTGLCREVVSVKRCFVCGGVHYGEVEDWSL